MLAGHTLTLAQAIVENGHPFRHVSVDDGDAENGPGPVRVTRGYRWGQLYMHTHDSIIYIESKACSEWGYPRVWHEVLSAGLADRIYRDAEACDVAHTEVY